MDFGRPGRKRRGIWIEIEIRAERFQCCLCSEFYLMGRIVFSWQVLCSIPCRQGKAGYHRYPESKSKSKSVQFTKDNKLLNCTAPHKLGIQ